MRLVCKGVEGKFVRKNIGRTIDVKSRAVIEPNQDWLEFELEA